MSVYGVLAWRNALAASNLPRHAKAIGQTLANYMNGSGSCYPSIQTVADDAGYGRSQTKRALLALVAAGFLKMDSKRGQGQTCRYHARIGEQPLPDKWSTHGPLNEEPDSLMVHSGHFNGPCTDHEHEVLEHEDPVLRNLEPETNPQEASVKMREILVKVFGDGGERATG